MPKFFWALTQILLSCACFMEKDPMIVADILFSFFKNPIWCCKINTKNEESYFCCDKKSFKLNELLSFRKLCVELDSVNVFRMTCFLYTFWYIFVFVRKIGKDLTTVLAQKYIIYSFHFLLIHFSSSPIFHFWENSFFQIKNQMKDLHELFLYLEW